MHPYPYMKKRMHNKRKSILKEIDGRYSEFNSGGSPSKSEKISSYKQAAIKIAYMLDKYEKASPAQLRKMGTGHKTQNILSMNVYGWFDKIERGIYKLNTEGKKSYRKYDKLITIFEKQCSE